MSPTLSLPPDEAVYLLLASLPLLVLSEHRSRSLAGTFLFKMLSSVAFAIGPVLRTTTQPSPYGQLVAAGLVFSLLGDFLLLPSRQDFSARARRQAQPRPISVSFQLGVVAFAAAHIAYIVAFLRDSQEIVWSTFATTFVATLVVAKWLGVIYPPAQSSAQSNVLDLAIAADMKPLVLAYAIIISGMFAAATSAIPTATAGAWPYQRTLGGVMFVASDVFVAKDAFGKSSDPGSRGWVRIAVGYGLYFWGQMVIAGTASV